MLKIILDRGTNKCCIKDITKYVHEYQIKRSSTSTKTSTSTSTKYDKYILLPFRLFRCIPHTLPYGSCTQLHSAPTQPPRSPHAAVTPPPRLPHAAVTSPPRHCTQPQSCLHAAATQPPRRLHAAPMLSTPYRRRPKSMCVCE